MQQGNLKPEEVQPDDTVVTYVRDSKTGVLEIIEGVVFKNYRGDLWVKRSDRKSNFNLVMMSILMHPRWADSVVHVDLVSRPIPKIAKSGTRITYSNAPEGTIVQTGLSGAYSFKMGGNWHFVKTGVVGDSYQMLDGVIIRLGDGSSGESP